MEEQEDTAAGLVSNAANFLGSGGSGQEDGRCGGATGSDQDPAFFTAPAVFGGRVFDEVEAQGSGKEGDGFVVIANDQGYVAYGLGQVFSLLRRCRDCVSLFSTWPVRGRDAPATAGGTPALLRSGLYCFFCFLRLLADIV